MEIDSNGPPTPTHRKRRLEDNGVASVAPMESLIKSPESGGKPISHPDYSNTAIRNRDMVKEPNEKTGQQRTSEDETQEKETQSIFDSILWNIKLIITCSWINVLLVFVPVGIAVKFIPGVPAAVIFTMNCIAIIPLAGLLAHATESVAAEMGDALGALMNVSFGNTVELIIFIIALAKNQIRIVQASILGSILANLLLILGMGFFLGGMRYREQLYNSTVTQMSACLLSLSVVSLVLPTAFHASFSDTKKADLESLKISRGTSIILLLVYILFLVFQLKSHAYMYESTPRELVDAEALPGPAAAWLDGNDFVDESSSGSSSDSVASNRSRPRSSARVRVKRVLHGRKTPKARRSSHLETEDNTTPTLAPTTSHAKVLELPRNREWGPQLSNSVTIARTASVETMIDGLNGNDAPETRVTGKKHRKRRQRHRTSRHQNSTRETNSRLHTHYPQSEMPYQLHFEPNRSRIDCSIGIQSPTNHQRGLYNTPHSSPQTVMSSLRHLAPAIFTSYSEFPPVDGPSSPRHYWEESDIGRTSFLPCRRKASYDGIRAPGSFFPAHVCGMERNNAAAAVTAATAIEATTQGGVVGHKHMCKKAAILLLIISTGLVALCAEFLVSCIEQVTESSALSETFIGLIILPIVGNAAEHITSVTVAMKNKMDLAIGVAIGSSIQIALFVTPMIVVLAWCMDKDLSLYFTLFETVCLFLSAFIVNFLVLDGRSNYMEGALLCAVYVIIGVVAFYYPDVNEAGEILMG